MRSKSASKKCAVGVFAIQILCCVAYTATDRQGPVVPDWVEENRVQAHSEHGLSQALALTPAGHAKSIRAMGADVLCRVYLTRGEGAWWQSAVGEINPLIGTREFATEISDAVHGEGMKVIAYFRHMSDDLMQQNHPDWVCRNPDGSPALEPRGKTQTVFILCMNSPYREYIKTRVVELAGRGVDGIYFDSFHMPDICICKYCQTAFHKNRGKEMEVGAPVGSEGYLEAVDFVNRTMVETFSEWREAVDAVAPEVLFVIKSSRFPLFESPHIDTRLLAMSDVSGTEFDKAFGGNLRQQAKKPHFAGPAFDDQLALGWSLVRDGSQGRPPHMWIPHLRSERTALCSAAAALTYGCIANMNVTLRDLEKDAPRNGELFPSTFEVGKRISPALAYTRPFAFVSLHVGAASRNRRLGDPEVMWREIFAPTLGAFQALREENIPCLTVADDALEKGVESDTKVLILPCPDELTAAQSASVARFETAGGTVVRLDPKSAWHDDRKKGALLDDLRATLRHHAIQFPLRVSGPADMHTTFYRHPDGKRLVICLANTWRWFRSTRDPNPELNDGTPPPPCSGVAISLEGKHAKATKAAEAVRDQDLVLKREGGSTRIDVPDFQINACIAVEY